MLSLQLLRRYPLLNIRSNTLSKARNHPRLSCLNSAAIWSAPSTWGQTPTLRLSGSLGSKVHVTLPLDVSIFEESNRRTNAISVFNWNKKSSDPVVVVWEKESVTTLVPNSICRSLMITRTMIIFPTHGGSPRQCWGPSMVVRRHPGASLINTLTGSFLVAPPMSSW